MRRSPGVPNSKDKSEKDLTAAQTSREGGKLGLIYNWLRTCFKKFKLVSLLCVSEQNVTSQLTLLTIRNSATRSTGTCFVRPTSAFTNVTSERVSQRQFKMKFLAVFDSLSNKTFACSEKKRAYQNRWTKALCLYYYCVFNFIKVYFINAFHCFWCFLFWVRSLALNNHFPDL